MEYLDVSNFEKARDNLQTPKRLRLGSLLVAVVDASPSGIEELNEIVELQPTPDEVGGDPEGRYGEAWLRTIFEEWGRLSENFTSIS